MPDFGRWTGGGGDPSLNEINRADRFIDALSATQPVYSTDPAEAELAFLLSDWRDDVREAPITAPVTERDAVDALHGGLSSGRRSRTSLALVGSVAAALMCVGGFGAAVYGSGPGDSLYGMRSSLFGTQQTTRDDQVSLASAQLQQVQQLIDQGQWQQAQDKLVEVSSAVQNVEAVQSKQDLVEQWNALTYKVVEQNPAATLPPGEPLPVLPSSPLTWLPVPVVEATTTSETTVTSGSTTSGSPVPSEPTDTSDTSVTSVPPEVVLTPPPEGSTGPSTSVPSTSVPTTVPPTSVPATTVPPTSVPSTSAVPSTTVTSAPPVVVTTTVPPSTATTTTTTTVAPAATTTTRPVPPPPASAEPPAASAPRLAPSSPKPQAPAPVSEPAVSSAPVVSSQPKAPTTTAAPQESQGGAGVQGGETGSGPVTTTIMPPR